MSSVFAQKNTGTSTQNWIQVKFGSEFEWFMFKESPESIRSKNYHNLTPLSPGMFGYSMLRTSEFQDITHHILTDLMASGIPLEGCTQKLGLEYMRQLFDSVMPLRWRIDLLLNLR